MQTLVANESDRNPTKAPVITVQNLNHFFGHGQLRKQVLFDINLEINAGEIVIMTGPSGSGKTVALQKNRLDIRRACFRRIKIFAPSHELTRKGDR